MAAEIISKRCRTCKEIKPISEFYKASTNRDGFRNDCKACFSKYFKEYNQTERGKTRKKRYAQSEKGKAQKKCYQQSEKSKSQIKCYQQSEKGRKVHAVAANRFNIRHPEQVKAREAVFNAVKTGRLPRPDSLFCHYCPKPAQQYHH